MIGSRHVLVDNRARVDGVGYVVFGGDIDLVGNHATFGGDGSGGVSDGLGYGNVSRRNLGAGFRFDGVRSLRVEKNRAEQNGKGGFVLEDVVVGDFKKNAATGNFGGPGIHVTATANRKLRMRENASTRHFAPFHDLTDDQLCTNTQWIENASSPSTGSDVVARSTGGGVRSPRTKQDSVPTAPEGKRARSRGQQLDTEDSVRSGCASGEHRHFKQSAGRAGTASSSGPLPAVTLTSCANSWQSRRDSSSPGAAWVRVGAARNASARWSGCRPARPLLPR